jgi:hypothetical protein
MMEQDILICECSSSEHQMIMRYFPDDDYPMVYVDVHLVKRSFWDRVKYALMYVFGYKSKYGAWDEIILGPKHINGLQNVVDHLKKIEAKELNDRQNIHS